MEEAYLTVGEAAKKLGVNRCRVYVWINEGRLPYEYLPNLFGMIVKKIPLSKCIHPPARKPGPLMSPDVIRCPLSKPKLGRKKYTRKQPVRIQT